MEMCVRPSAFEYRVLKAVDELEGLATFGNLPAYLRIEDDLALAFSGHLPKWAKWLLMKRPLNRQRVDIALANLRDRNQIVLVRNKAQRAWYKRLLGTRGEAKRGRLFCITFAGVNALRNYG